MLWLAQSVTNEPGVWDSVFENFFSPGMAMKLGFIAITAPIWAPIAKVLWSELKVSLTDDSDEFAPSHSSPKRPEASAGNPWVSIPYAVYRKQGKSGAAREADRQAAGTVRPQPRAGRSDARRPSRVQR